MADADRPRGLIAEDATPGVYLAMPDGGWSLVHAYGDEDYALQDIPGYFEIGTPVTEPPAGLRLERRDLRRLKALADHHSFDYPEQFIEMCLEMHRAALPLPGDILQFAERE